MRISAVIIAMNEEKNIAACLDSLTWADEVIVIDSESTDRTVEICGRYPNTRALVERWRGDASQRNFGIEQATGDWILNVDADERVTDRLKTQILAFKEGKAGDHDAYQVNFMHYMDGRWMSRGDYHPDYKVRFFRAHLRFTKEVHAAVNAKCIGRFDGSLIHHTYKNLEDALAKINKYTSLEAAILKDSFHFTWYTWLRPFYYFFKVYVLQQSFRNGTLGLASSFLRFYNNFSLYFKIWELKQADMRARREA